MCTVGVRFNSTEGEEKGDAVRKRKRKMEIRLRNRSAGSVLKDLLKDGWFVEYQQGGHKQLAHPMKSGKITIPGIGTEPLCYTLRS